MQDYNRYDSIQLLSENDIIDIYYQKLRNAMDTAASEAKMKNGFDGTLLEEDSKNLAEFCSSNEVSELSQVLAELLMSMERHGDKKSPEIKDTAIYNALLRLEKATHNTSAWEICAQDEEDYSGPDLNFSNFEVNMVELQLSQYIGDLLRKHSPQTLFFPLDGFYESDAIVKWRILEKIATIKLVTQDTIYKQKLKFHLQERLKDEVSTWVKKETEKLKLSGMASILKDTEALSKIMKDLRTQINNAIDISMSMSMFKEAGCNFLEILAETVDDILFPLCERVMETMDSYQTRHKDFHVNIRDSCALSHLLYLQCKKLAFLLTTHGKIERHLKLQDYDSIFGKFFVNLLQVMKLECHNRIKRAVQAEIKDTVHHEERILSSSVIVLNCMCTVIDEWKRMEIEDEEQKIAFLVKITDIICDGAKIFAESLDHRLNAMNFPLKDIEALKKVCVLANSIEHVLQYLQELPQQMQYSEVLGSTSEDSSGTSLKEQVLRILKLLHHSMNTHMSDIVTKMLTFAVNGVYNNVEKLFMSWLQSQSPNQMFDKFIAHLNEFLETLADVLKESLFSQFLSHLWSFLITNTQKHFQEGQPLEYARTVKDNVMNLKGYLLHINMAELDVHKPLLQQLMDLLELNSKSTEELQLDYYVQIAESVVSPVEYLGHIAFQAGYKTVGNDTVDLHINVQKGQRLPARKFEMSQLVVKVELCPNSLFPSQVPLKSSQVTEDLDNPVFNEFFLFSKLPSSVLDVKGAVVQVLVLNQDYSYSAEAILLLNQVQNMSGIASLEFLPVYLMPLRKFDMSHISYQVLENRSRWDKNAKAFINKRAKLSKNHKKGLSCLPGKGMICSFSRND